MQIKTSEKQSKYIIFFWRKWKPSKNNLFKVLFLSKHCIFIDTSSFVLDFDKRDVKSLKFFLQSKNLVVKSQRSQKIASWFFFSPQWKEITINL